MGRKGIYGGWTNTGTRRVWVRVPAALKENGNGNGNGHHANGNGSGSGAADTPPPVESEKLPVVLVHGIGVSSRSVEPLLLALGESRPVFAPDLPGFGLSEAPLEVLDIPELADALRRWMLDSAINPAAIVASASGCQVAIDLAARYPGVVERLVLVGPTLDPESRSPGGLALRWAKGITRDSIRRAPGAIHDVIDAGPRRAARSLGRAFDDPTEHKLPRIQAPTMVLRAERDRLAPADWARRIAAGIPGADLRTIPSAPRASAASAAPALAELVEGFLQQELPVVEPVEPAPGERATGHGRLIVDGMKIIGARPDGWWQDRPKAWRDLRRDLERYAQRSGDDVVLVLDGSRPAGWREDELVETAFARGGRDAADDSIVARVKAHPDPASLTVVTSDRGLAARVGELGAETMSANRFRDRL
jgi:pimeloyl-ACP methyl ester carboxylesterase/predicted RNA-binding protein with PIN domain